jgi:hypothetical protein
MHTKTCWTAVLFCFAVGLLQSCSYLLPYGSAGGSIKTGSNSSQSASSGGISGTGKGSAPGSATSGSSGWGGGTDDRGTHSTSDTGTGTTSPGSSPTLPDWPTSSSSKGRYESSFPWPPPRASATTTIPLRAAMESWRSEHYFPPRPAHAPVFLSPDKLAEFFSRSPPQLTHADHALRYILSSAGYVETSYHPIPDGFAMVTRLEQIEADGRPKEPGRWEISGPAFRSFSILEYLRALFTAPPGHYRILVFTVTPVPVTQSSASVSSGEAGEWLRSGSDILPEKVGNQEFNWNYHCTVLIYEFEHGSARSKAALRYPGLPATSHLTGAGLTALLP